jgi:exodeoxyribonuclease-3
VVFVSYNINGFRAALSKGLEDFLSALNADFIMFQETKADVSLEFNLKGCLKGYSAEWNCSERCGYAGSAIFFKKKPVSVKYGFGNKKLDGEGRLIVLEYPSFFVINVYVPNSRGNLERWYYRLDWDEALIDYLTDLRCRKPVIIGGDFNVARDYIDVYPENTKNLENYPGFREEERSDFDKLLDAGFVDTFRFLFPDKCGAYTWWSGTNRKYNRGRRIDYFLVSEGLEKKIRGSEILSDVTFSDHAPIKLTLEKGQL